MSISNDVTVACAVDSDARRITRSSVFVGRVPEARDHHSGTCECERRDSIPRPAGTTNPGAMNLHRPVVSRALSPLEAFGPRTRANRCASTRRFASILVPRVFRARAPPHLDATTSTASARCEAQPRLPASRSPTARSSSAPRARACHPLPPRSAPSMTSSSESSRARSAWVVDLRTASASKRARSGVTPAVRQGKARIGEHHPELGEHLDRAVRTGTYCAYVPDPGTTTAWAP